MRKLHPVREQQLEAAQNNVFGLKNLNNNNTSILENPEDTSGINEANRQHLLFTLKMGDGAARHGSALLF